MAIRKIARMGHPVLRSKARNLTETEIKSEDTRRLIGDMIETMAEYGGIGLAAPQIHEPLRVAIIGFDGGSSRYPGMGESPLTVIFNPTMTVLDSIEQGFWEGCLSVPELRGLVFRPRKIQIDFLDHEASPRRLVVEDFLATVFQHELDHLDGVLYVDRIRNGPGVTPIAFTEEYEKYLAPSSDDEVGELAD